MEKKESGPVRRTILESAHGPTSQKRDRSKQKRFCFPMTFIWALGDIGVRALHKSDVAVCECRHCDKSRGDCPVATSSSSFRFSFILLQCSFLISLSLSLLSLSFSLYVSFSSSFFFFFSFFLCSHFMSLPQDSRAQYGASCSAYNVSNHCFMCYVLPLNGLASSATRTFAAILIIRKKKIITELMSIKEFSPDSPKISSQRFV